jgi:hypothetical protein
MEIIRIWLKNYNYMTIAFQPNLKLQHVSEVPSIGLDAWLVGNLLSVS